MYSGWLFGKKMAKPPGATYRRLGGKFVGGAIDIASSDNKTRCFRPPSWGLVAMTEGADSVNRNAGSVFRRLDDDPDWAADAS